MQIVDRTDFEFCAAELASISEKWFKDDHLDYKCSSSLKNLSNILL